MELIDPEEDALKIRWDV